MLLGLWVLLVVVGGLEAVTVPDCNTIGPCTFYESCVEATVPCGPTGYALGFGNKFCNLFMDKLDKFSPRGQKWVLATASCLQRKLVPLVTSSLAPECPGIKQVAYDSHPQCYATPTEDESISFCKLSIGDWKVVLDIVKSQLVDRDSWKQILETLGQCSKVVLKMFKKAFDDL